jgi:preprotein translocase subunit YajC
MSVLFPILAVLAVFLLFRSANPQRRRAASQQTLRSQLTAGDRVVTAGGMIGTLVGIEGDRAAVEVAPDVIVEFLLAGILRRDEVAEVAGAPVAEPPDELTDTTEPATGDHPAGRDDAPPPPAVPSGEDPSAPHHEES